MRSFYRLRSPLVYAPSIQGRLAVSCKALLVWAFLMVVSGCAASRPPIPVGEVPQWHPTSMEDQQYGHQVLTELARLFPLSKDSFELARARSVVRRLAQASGSPPDAWRVYLFDDRRVKNAAATRGNYVFLWTGMLRFVQNDDELAAVVAHEIAHVLADHVMPNPAEQLSDAMTSASGIATSGIMAASGSIAAGAAQLGGALVEQGIRGLVINPESRRKEYEADQIGLFLMSDAGYDPRNAISFWERARRDPDFGGGPLEFLSSHPSSEKRSEYLRSLLPAALQHSSVVNFDQRTRHSQSGGPRGSVPSPDRQQPPIPQTGPVEASVEAQSARIFEGDDPWGEVRDVALRGESVTIVCRSGSFYRVIAPTHGFIDIRAFGPMTVRWCPQERGQ